MTLDPLLAVYALPLVIMWLVFYRNRRKAEVRYVATREAAKVAGLTEPSSLHPVIDPALCMGCGACVSACPEGEIIGLIEGKAELIEPSSCIGHGACRAACPFDAISLVFGTETRGMDIPHVDAEFQTNVPGIYIAGELGGMGLIRNAIEQGKQAVYAIAAQRKSAASDAGLLDVLIVGSGPAGLSATLGAKAKGLRYATVEQDTLGGTIAHFPRGKLVMTRPADLPIVGKMNFREVSKEVLLGFWQEVVRKSGITINYQERVDAVTPMAGGGFDVTTSRARYRTRNVLLAIGRRGTPRKLEVPGEEQGKVVYRLQDAEQYQGQKVAVIGGGDSAIEAALALADEPGTEVVLSYRSEAFSRLKPKNRAKLDAYTKARRVTLMLKSVVKQIGAKSLLIEQDGRRFEIANDRVIVCAGGILPTGFLTSIGVEVETKHGTA
jgi:thioredoxin reductase (NADPH)